MPKLAGTLQGAADMSASDDSHSCHTLSVPSRGIALCVMNNQAETTLATQGLRYSVTTLDGPMYVRKDEILASSSKVITSITSTRWPEKTTCT